MSRPRVYADFHNLDGENRPRLTCRGTVQDLERQAITLSEGLALTLYTDDEDESGERNELEMEGAAHFDREGRTWVAKVDWGRLRRSSERTDRTPRDVSFPA